MYTQASIAVSISTRYSRIFDTEAGLPDNAEVLVYTLTKLYNETVLSREKQRFSRDYLSGFIQHEMHSSRKISIN